MKRILVFFTVLFLAACGQSRLSPDVSDSGDQGAVSIVVAKPTIELDIDRGGPNTAVSVQGSGFPAETWVILRLGISEINLSQAYAQVITSSAGEFVTDMMMPTTWDGADLSGQTELLIVAETADRDLRARAEFTLQYEGAFQTYQNEEVGFALEIPEGWVVTEPQTTPLGEMVLLGLGEPTSGDPMVSTILVADSSKIRAVEAVNLLQCGTLTCQERVSLGITEIGGLDARQAVIGSENTPDLEWFFIDYNGRLVYFSLHDPTTLQTLQPIVDSFHLLELVDLTELAEVVSTETAVPATATVTDVPEVDAAVENDEADEDVAVSVPTSTPTSTATSTIEPTETPKPTESATPTVMATPTKTATPTSTPTETATLTPIPPTETPEATATRADPFQAGPLQTVINLISIILGDDVAEDTFDYFSEEVREGYSSVVDIENSLFIGFMPSNFEVNRVQGKTEVIVEVFFSTTLGNEAVRYVWLTTEQDRWRVYAITDQVDGISAGEPEATSDPTVTPEATVTDE